MKLGILDQMAQPKNSSAEKTASDTIKMAQAVEKLGYERYWFAEHHATKGLASTAPEIMMATVAAQTVSLKVGSGGILLPQYSPFKVASQLAQLQALFPGRIEAGVGRSAGGPETIRSLLADGKPNQVKDYPKKLKELTSFMQKTGRIRVGPRVATPPKLFSLGLGENSASLAAQLGIGYVFGHFLNPDRGIEAHKTYRENFKPNLLQIPKAHTAIFIICGETDAHAERIASSQDAWLLQVEKGLDSRIPSIDEANSIQWSAKDLEKIQQNRKRMIIGGPTKVKKALLRLTDMYQCDSWLILTNIYDYEEKLNSYERILKLF